MHFLQIPCSVIASKPLLPTASALQPAHRDVSLITVHWLPQVVIHGHTKVVKGDQRWLLVSSILSYIRKQ